MKRRVITFIAAICSTILASQQHAAAAEHMTVSADSLKFYGDRFLLEGDGNVSVTLDRKYTIHGNAFSMDLRLNRFVVGGDVTVTGEGVDLHGAGIADFFDTHRMYFIPVLSQPDRWTYDGTDFAHPSKGLEMPGDPFYFPDVSTSRVTVISHRAEIEPLTYVEFFPAKIWASGILTPLPSYVLNFSGNPDWKQNSLAGAIVDIPWDFAGSPRFLSTLHLRYDQTNHAYASFEEHYVASPGTWAVISLNPATQVNKQYNFISNAVISSHLQAYAFAQAFAYQPGFSTPLSLSSFARLQLTYGLPSSFFQVQLNQNWDSLLPMPPANQQDPTLLYYWWGNPSHPWVPMHPFNGLITWQGDTPLRHLPLSFRLRGTYGWAHDNSYVYYSYGLQFFPPSASPSFSDVVNTISYTTVDALVYSHAIRVAKNYYFTFSEEGSRQTYSLPHRTDQVQSTATISRTYGTKLATFAGYQVTNIADDYGPSLQRLYYPETTFGGTYPGYAAFDGFATFRSVYGQAVYTPNPNFSLSFMLKSNNNFPASMPGIFGTPPTQLFGDVRFRISPHAMVDVARTYSFNFGGLTWGPSFTVQVLP
ncbi:MAG: hypothetical protein JOZ38_12535 [Candidatus Eremiobacteraeota bacterium]|nr:hypothetical protein [Candidatus Eremiobacteraeota bacterium]